MSARSRSVAAVQLRAHDRADFSEAWPHILARIAEAADHGAELIVVPEGTVPGYVLGNDPVDSRQIERAAEDVIAIASRSGATIVYGSGRYDGENFMNSAYVVTASGIVGTSDKCFLWHFDRRWFHAGSALEPIDTPAGRLGVFICADGRIPTIASTLVDRGAEILVMPTAWVTSGRDSSALENLQADLMINVRARENGVPLVAANKCGVERRSTAYCGKSAIVAADGSLVARASQNEDVTLRGSVAIGSRLVSRVPLVPSIVRGTSAVSRAEVVRVAIAPKHDPALHALAALADVDLVIDPHTTATTHDMAIVDDEAMVDPRALVAPRLDGVCFFVWHASIGAAWVKPFARTRAAELRAYIVVLDTLDRCAFAVDPDGTIVCGTYEGYDLASFSFERRRTEAWLVAPHTDVRTTLEAVATIAARATEPSASS